MSSIRRIFAEHLGGTNATQFIGKRGDIFWDPESTDLRMSDGQTPGGMPANGGSEPQIWIAEADSTLAYSNTQAVAYDSLGNVFSLMYQGPRSEANSRVSIAKFSPEGLILWTRDLSSQYSVNPWSLVTEYQDNIYVIAQHYNGNLWNNTLVKLSGIDGTIIWQKELQDSNNSDNMQLLSINSEFKGVAVLGTAWNGSSNDFFIGIMDSNGGTFGVTNLGDEWNQEAYGAAINNANGDILIAGRTNTNGPTFMEAIKFNIISGAVWQNAYTLDDGYDLIGTDVTWDNNGNWVIVGTHNANNIQGIVTIKLNDFDGSVIWSKEIANGCANVSSSVAADLNGNIYISGSTYSGRQAQNGPPLVYRILGAYDQNGEILWQKYLRGTDNQWVVDNNWWNGIGSTGKVVDIYGDRMVIGAVASAWDSNIEIGLVAQFPRLGLDQGIGSYELRQSFLSDSPINIFYNGTNFQYSESSITPVDATSIISIKSDLSYYVNHAGASLNKLINGAKSVILGSDGDTVFPGDVADPNGSVRSIPRKAVLNETNYNLTRLDNGQFFYGENSTIYVPAMNNEPLPIGFTVTIITNENNSLYVYAQDAGLTKILVPGLTGTNAYFIPAKSVATLIKVDTETWYLYGTGIGND